MDRMRHGFRLTRQALDVLRADKELAILPIAGMIGWAAVGLGLYLAVYRRWPTGSDFELPGAFVRIYPIFIVATIVPTFANAAVVAATCERLNGGDPTVRSGLQAAWGRKGSLVLWTLLAGVVGLILQAVAERLKIAGRLATWAVGLAWQLATILVVPIIVVEDEPVPTAVRRSAHLFKERWGEGVTGYGAIGLVTVLVMLPAMAVAAVVGLLIGPVATIVLVALVFGAFIAVSGAINGIFNTALYQYAVSGEAAAGFDRDDLAGAFRPKRRRRRRRS